MRYETATILLAFFGLTAASPLPDPREGGKFPVIPTPPRMLRGREVPQEHSHEQFITTVRASLQLNNPDNIQDPIFGLLGSAAAAVGQGSISDTDCLHQATADQAFTNAKAAGDVDGQVAALVFQSLERNTGKVGLASVNCTSITPVNAEIAAIHQHQDPASADAAAINKASTLALAVQIASVGGDPQIALKAGTFAPGSTSDNTGRGNACDDQNDSIGCIFTQNLLVEDATAAEISAAVSAAGVSVSSSASTSAVVAAAATSTAAATATATASAAASVCSVAMTTVTAASAATTTAAAVAAAATTTAAASGTNVQTFTGALGGISAPAVTQTSGDRPFSVNGSIFVNAAAALQRSCSIQHNQCADAANSGSLSGGVSQCETQEDECNAAA